MQEFIIKSNEAGQRLDKFLHKYLKEAPNSFLYKMLRKKNITLNKKKADGKEILNEGDCICFFFSEETFLKFRGQEHLQDSFAKNKNHTSYAEYETAYQKIKGVEIIFENEHVAFLNKPTGILSQKSNQNDFSLNEWWIGYLLHEGSIQRKQLETFKPSICNRLDRNTSGMVVCGKSLIGTQTMNRLLKERSLKKYYRTFVKGKVSKEAYCKGFLKKDESQNQVFFQPYLSQKDSGFVAIETAYRPISYLDGCTYLEVELITGKTHQIRAHLAALGHPILGDTKYGDGKWNQKYASLLKGEKQLLHSYRMEMPLLEAPLEELSHQVFLAKEPEIYEILKTRMK